jgi:hypothetical protein
MLRFFASQVPALPAAAGAAGAAAGPAVPLFVQKEHLAADGTVPRAIEVW